MSSPGTLHLIPVGLGDSPTDTWLPVAAQEQARRLTIYIAENAKTARAFLKQVGTPHPLQSITIHTLEARTRPEDIRSWLAAAQQGQDIGLVSEAGCPAVADPGALVAAQAHRMGIPVRPWTGPSSLLLALMASGLDGQRFAFHGYAPVEPGERAKRLKQWEAESRKHRQTQLFIETPYRNEPMFKALTQALHGGTRLCIARALTTPEEWIRTCTIDQWKSRPPPDLNKKPSIFLFLAS
ncbi:SAM-dependent methyltransferase [Pusillimonas sp. CC-YST705]|uniref:SAM-dependent methyltransferase n=1 Tax=Mesopusillimonas faecipullorum TaxID=2755040 RepID=A0ABS8C9C5_9BURK|nr:SAM-dependent methyltransferase [Mesopusillimonas faecipullorum]MCB5362447.1 SAM-dependent methyltransferase [Mesopusillimonas faecipullorum]